MRMTSSRILIAALAAALLAACSGDSSTGTTSLAGTYDLTTVNGAALPFVIQASAPKVELMSDRIIVNVGNTFSESGSLRETDGSTVSLVPFTDGGTYAVSGTAVTFVYASNGSSGTGTVGSGTFTIAQDGASSVYVKQ